MNEIPEYSLLEWRLIPWKNKDYDWAKRRFWLKINGGIIEIKIKDLYESLEKPLV